MTDGENRREDDDVSLTRDEQFLRQMLGQAAAMIEYDDWNKKIDIYLNELRLLSYRQYPLTAQMRVAALIKLSLSKDLEQARMLAVVAIERIYRLERRL